MKSLFTILITLFLFQACTKYDEGKMKNEIFQKFLSEIAVKSPIEKQVFADQFYESIKGQYPIYQSDSSVVLLYKGDVDSLFLLGDMGDWFDKYKFEKVEGTDLFYYVGNYEPEARLEYWLMFSDNDFPITDPLNEFKVRNGLGELSELAMPGYKRHEYFDKFIRGEQGNFDLVIEENLNSKILNYDHKVHVYLPPGYENDDKNYPVVYFQDGRDYIEFAIAPVVIDNLIKSEKIEPVIAVFVTPPNLHQPKFPNRSTEYGMNDDYVNFFVKELVPFIDSKYKTILEPESRMVTGDSYGGLISFYISFSNPLVFKNSYSQSGYHSFEKDKLIKMVETTDRLDLNFYFDVGTYEKVVGASFLPEGERNFLEGNRRLKKALEEKKYKFVYNEYYEGHTWGNWRRHLIGALEYFFGTGETK